ncbi:MAG TPA: hydroxymethylglutaryl-CoA lyase [Daejeonella sp.]|nr:hydroxymethylglutaryl-CoA lyase [Daejeonella sp.]
MIKLIECPRDAMQGLHAFIPTEIKAQYLNLLLQVGFDTLDFGSFVSAKAIPQLKDTVQVLEQLNLSDTRSKLLAIVANIRGVQDAVQHKQIHYVGFPFSISETFQQRNTNSSIAQSIHTVEELVDLCAKHQKTAVVYLSMGFGNPYGDEWSHEIVEHWTAELVERGVQIISLADTIGISSPEKISYIFPHLVKQFPNIEFGVHLHSRPESWKEKIEAAYQSGCTRFDSALKGFGGCPMAADDLTGNIATENLIYYFQQQGQELNLNMDKWQEAMEFSSRIFG